MVIKMIIGTELPDCSYINCLCFPSLYHLIAHREYQSTTALFMGVTFVRLIRRLWTIYHCSTNSIACKKY